MEMSSGHHLNQVIIRNNQKRKQHIHPSINGWIHKLCHSHKMEYYWAVKRNEVLMRTTTQITNEPENVMLTEKCQSQRPHIVRF